MLRWVSLGLLLALAPSSARAATVVILPRAGGSGLDLPAVDRAVEAVTTVLRNDGWRVLDVADAAGLDPRLAACGPEDRCGWELAEVLGADVAVGVRAFGEGDQIERVSVVVIGRRGVGQRAVAVVEDGVPMDFAAAEATRAAVEAWRNGAIAFSPPRGAPNGEGSAPAPALEDAHLEADPANWVVGTFLLLGSVPLLGFGINTIARDGQCVTEGPGDTCAERVRFGAGAGIFTGIGAALALSGIAIWILQPLRIGVRASATEARLEVEGRF